MRGRKPTPSSLSFIRGNPGKRPPKLYEPKPPAEMPQCPEHLDEKAKKKWDVFAPDLFNLGILTKIDADLFAAFCQEFSFWQDALERLKKLKPTKAVRYSPTHRSLIKAARAAEAAMNKLGVEYGITASSRSRIQATPTNPDEDDEEGFFG